MKIIDSHVHLNLQQFDSDREEVFKRIEEKLDFVVNIGFDLESSEKSVEYANKYPFMYAVIGFHPDEIERYNDEAEKKLVDVVKEIPIEKLVIETDCPYMAPTPYRGQRNEPIYTEEVAKKIAEVKNMSYEDVVRITNENTRKVFKML